jgi:hypothetical protein
MGDAQFSFPAQERDGTMQAHAETERTVLISLFGIGV